MSHALKSRLLDIVHKSPSLFALVGPRNEKPQFERRVLRRGDALMLDGYPRSANTFATQAFRMAQHENLMIGNHFHSPMQVHLAKRYHLPAGVFYRDPMDAALSLMVFYEGKRSAEWTLTSYINFYSRVLLLDEGWVPISMSEAIGPMGVWVNRINQTFGTEFKAAPYSGDWASAVKAAVEAKRKKRLGGNGNTAASLARQTTPSEYKTKMRAQALSLFDQKSLQPLKEQATSVFLKMEERHAKFIAHENKPI